MPNFNPSVELVLKKEGWFSNHPYDPGEETMYGITKGVARRYGYGGPMKYLPLDVAKEIYQIRYWNKMRCGEIPSQLVVDKMMCIGTNCGAGVAMRSLQYVMNGCNREERDWLDIEEDGKIGPVTIREVRKAIPKRRRQLWIGLFGEQVHHYLELARRKKKLELFVNGWLTRAASHIIKYHII